MNNFAGNMLEVKEPIDKVFGDECFGASKFKF
jgi:hypothetical protein